MRVVLLAVCSANVVAFLQRHADADERHPSNDAPTSRSLMFATVPQKMSPSEEMSPSKGTYSSNAGSGNDTPITKLFLVGHTAAFAAQRCKGQGELVSTVDLNQRAGGKYIYLCASRRTAAEDASGSAPAVDDVRIQTSSSCPTGWKSPEKFDGLNGDLNQEAGGKDIFMCYKTGGSDSGWEPGDLQSVAVVTGKDAACPSGSSRVTTLNGLDGDLNQEAGGDWIYLCKALHIPKCGPPGVGKQFASGKSATTPCGTNCGACFEDILTCGALPSGKQFASGKTATFPCGTTCATTCFEDKFPKPFNSPWFCTDRPDDPKDPSDCNDMSTWGDNRVGSEFIRDEDRSDSSWKIENEDTKNIEFLALQKAASWHKDDCGGEACGVAKALKYSKPQGFDGRYGARTAAYAPFGIEKYYNYFGENNAKSTMYVVAPPGTAGWGVEKGEPFFLNVFADLSKAPSGGEISVVSVFMTYPADLYEVLGWEYGEYPQVSKLGHFHACTGGTGPGTLNCKASGTRHQQGHKGTSGNSFAGIIFTPVPPEPKGGFGRQDSEGSAYHIGSWKVKLKNSAAAGDYGGTARGIGFSGAIVTPASLKMGSTESCLPVYSASRKPRPYTCLIVK